MKSMLESISPTDSYNRKPLAGFSRPHVLHHWFSPVFIMTPPQSESTIRLITLGAISVLFMVMGILTALNDILIPHLKEVFQLSYLQALTIQTVWFSAYLSTGYPFGLLVRRASYKKGIVYGYLLCMTGCLLFLVSWLVDGFPAYLLTLFIIGAGVSLLQVVSNPYGAAMGKQDSAHQRLVFLHAFFALGTTLAPMILGPEILSESTSPLINIEQMSFSQTLADSILRPYLLLALLLALLAMCNQVLPMPDLLAEDRQRTDSQTDSAWRYKHTVLGAVAAFFYVGAEVLLGSFIINFIKTELPDMAATEMPVFVSIYWGGILAGRLAGPWFLAKVSPERTLMISALWCLLLVVVGISGSGLTAVFAIAAVGLGNSMMFPIIYGLSMKHLKPLVATQASGIISTAIAGGAFLPLIGGWLADQWGVFSAFWVSFISYAIILYYALAGCRSAPPEKTVHLTDSHR